MDFFMESEDYDSLSVSEKETKIKRRVDDMLLDNNFETPAAVLADNDPEMTSSAAYKEFINDKNAIGFVMRLGYEDVIHIAWSKKQGKVVVYLG